MGDTFNALEIVINGPMVRGMNIYMNNTKLVREKALFQGDIKDRLYYSLHEPKYTIPRTFGANILLPRYGLPTNILAEPCFLPIIYVCFYDDEDNIIRATEQELRKLHDIVFERESDRS
jgi:hypothetical protein